MPSDNLEALVKLHKEFSRLIPIHLSYIKTIRPRSPEEVELKYYDDFIEALAVFRSFCKSRNLNITFPDVGPNKKTNMNNITQGIETFGKAWQEQINKRTTQSLLTEKEEEYSTLFNSEQTYEFSDSDLKRIQGLINELRDLISTSKLITADHRRRLLRRLEAMQREIHKHTSDIDRFWGFVAEAGIVARKFGEDLQPITERVTEIGKIVMAVIMAKEGIKALPEITKPLNPLEGADVKAGHPPTKNR